MGGFIRFGALYIPAGTQGRDLYEAAHETVKALPISALNRDIDHMSRGISNWPHLMDASRGNYIRSYGGLEQMIQYLYILKAEREWRVVWRDFFKAWRDHEHWNDRHLTRAYGRDKARKMRQDEQAAIQAERSVRRLVGP